MNYLLRKSVAVPLLMVMLVFGLATWTSFSAVGKLLRSRNQIEQAHEFLRSLEKILAMATDAETGARGFLLTGEDDYLEPYLAAGKGGLGELQRARKLTEDSRALRSFNIERLTTLLDERTAMLEQQIILRREQGLATAVETVKDGKAKKAMDQIRQEIAGLSAGGDALLSQYRLVAQDALQRATIAGVCGIGVCALLFAFVFFRISGEMSRRDGAEMALRLAHENLEQRVVDRTAELQKAEEVAREARQKAEDASEAKGEFLSRVSHELRTPLNAILGFGQLMEMGGRLSAEQDSNLQHIMRGGRHLLALVDELLDLTAVESGRLPMSLEPVLLPDVVSEAVSMIVAQATDRGVDITVHPFPRADLHVTADRQRLVQVILNVFSNAVKFNRRGGSIDVTCTMSGENRIRLSVKDTGCGIEEADLETLFSPFGHTAPVGIAAEGAGLGLILSKRLITAMGGSMGVASKVAEGSTFWLELPPADPIALPPGGVTGAAAAKGLRDSGSKTILYIEDNLANLKLLEHILQDRTDITLVSSMQGSLGLDLARSKSPDLILLDLHLPDIHGAQVLRRLRAEPLTRDIPVVVLTADVTPRRVERIVHAGALACLAKPIDVRALFALMDRVLTEQRLDQPQN